MKKILLLLSFISVIAYSGDLEGDNVYVRDSLWFDGVSFHPTKWTSLDSIFYYWTGVRTSDSIDTRIQLYADTANKVTTGGTPANTYIARFTDNNTITGDTNLIYRNDSLFHKNAEYDFFGDFVQFDNYAEWYFNNSAPYFNFENASTSGNMTLSLTPTTSYLRTRDANNYGSVMTLYHDSLVNLSTYVTGQARTKLDSTGFIMKNENDSIFRFKLSGSKINSPLNINGDITSSVLNTSGSTKTQGYLYTGAANPPDQVIDYLNFDGIFRATRFQTVFSGSGATWSQAGDGLTIENGAGNNEAINIKTNSGRGGLIVKNGVGTSVNTITINRSGNWASQICDGNIIDITDNPSSVLGTISGKAVNIKIGSNVRSWINPRVSDTTAYLWGTGNPLQGEKHTVFMNQSDTLGYIDSAKIKSFVDLEVDGDIIGDSIQDKTTGRTAKIDYVIYPPYASMNFSDSSVLITLGVDTYEQITNAGDSLFRVRQESNGLTVTADTVFLLSEDAHYDYRVSIGFSTANGDNIRVALYDENGIVQSFGTSTTNAAAEESLSFSGVHYDDGINGKLWLEIKSEGGEDVTIIDGSFVVKFIHRIY